MRVRDTNHVRGDDEIIACKLAGLFGQIILAVLAEKIRLVAESHAGIVMIIIRLDRSGDRAEIVSIVAVGVVVRRENVLQILGRRHGALLLTHRQHRPRKRPIQFKITSISQNHSFLSTPAV